MQKTVAIVEATGYKYMNKCQSGNPTSHTGGGGGGWGAYLILKKHNNRKRL